MEGKPTGEWLVDDDENTICEWLARLNPTDDENLGFYGFSLALGVYGCKNSRTIFPLQGLSKMTSYESYLVQVHFEVAVFGRSWN